MGKLCLGRPNVVTNVLRETGVSEWDLEKKKETDSSQELLEGTQPCWHIDFCPLRPITDFWFPEF